MERIPFQVTAAAAAYDGVRKLPVRVLLENIRSLYNVGAFFRTCDAAGVDALHQGGIRIAPEHIDYPSPASGELKLLSLRRHVEGEEADSDRTVGARVDPIQLLTKGQRKG